jgi:hypothetical protein
MAVFWAEMGVVYLEINKRPCLHEIDIPKCINVSWRDWLLCFINFDMFLDV